MRAVLDRPPTLKWQAGTTSTADVARLFGVDHIQVWRWARKWHPPVGPGRRIRLTVADLLVFSAWQHITGGSGSASSCASQLPHAQRKALATSAEHAIRARPARWLALSRDWCATFPTAEEAADTWWQLPSPRPAATFIDLWGRP